jgi:hypothetical protein
MKDMPSSAVLHDMASLASIHCQAVMADIEPMAGWAQSPVSASDRHLLILSLSQLGKRMLDAEIWFQGFGSHLAAREQLGPELLEKTLQSTELTQNHIQSHHQQLLALAELRHNDEELAVCASLAAESASMLYNTLEKLRWTLMERQADADVEAGKVFTFHSPEETLAFLHSKRH